MPCRILILAILFALFIFLCGAGHLVRCLGKQEEDGFWVLNWLTALISMTTAVYLIPLTPDLMSQMDKSLDDLVKLNRETEESKEKLMTFMAFLCHEIRNPLFAITSTITFLTDEDMPPHQEQALSSIVQCANLMLRIVNDVLDISKIESGKLELEFTIFDLRNMMEGIATTGKNQTEKRGVDFGYYIDPRVPRLVISDSTRLLQITYNLISNALKFTKQGFINFSVSNCDILEATKKGLITHRDSYDDPTEAESVELLESAEEGVAVADMYEMNGKASPMSCAIKIEVEDTGCGIGVDRISHIFEPYTQSKLSDYREHGGTGLGLSIIARLGELMGGSIHVESNEGKGSKFTAYIPIRAPQSPSEIQKMQALTTSMGATSKLLTMVETNKPTMLRMGSKVADESGPVASSDTEVIEFSCNSEPLPKSNSESPTQKATKKKATFQKFDFPMGDKVVLVVDDNAINRKIIGRMLFQFNLEYAQAEDGQQAVDYILKSRNITGDPRRPYVSLVLMDMSMPVMDGTEATAEIRKLNIPVPIIVLTANCLEENKQAAIKAGATEFVTKPILRDDLNKRCLHYLLDRELTARLK